MPEEHLGVGDRGPGRRIRRDGAHIFEARCSTFANQQKDRANRTERRDRTAWNDAELWCQGGNGDETEIGCAAQKLGRTGGGCRVAQTVSRAQLCGARWMLEVPHQRGWIEKVDGGDAKFDGRVEHTDSLHQIQSWRCRLTRR